MFRGLGFSGLGFGVEPLRGLPRPALLRCFGLRAAVAVLVGKLPGRLGFILHTFVHIVEYSMLYDFSTVLYSIF